MMLWNAAGIWRDVAARRRGRRNMSGEAVDTTTVLAIGKARQRKSRIKPDGASIPSVDERTDAKTVSFPKTGDTLENDERDEEPDKETITGKQGEQGGSRASTPAIRASSRQRFRVFSRLIRMAPRIAPALSARSTQPVRSTQPRFWTPSREACGAACAGLPRHCL